MVFIIGRNAQLKRHCFGDVLVACSFWILLLLHVQHGTYPLWTRNRSNDVCFAPGVQKRITMSARWGILDAFFLMNQVRRWRAKQKQFFWWELCCQNETVFASRGTFIKEGTHERKGCGGTATCHACCAFPVHVLPGVKRCCGFSKQTQLGGRKSVTSGAQRERPRPFADLTAWAIHGCGRDVSDAQMQGRGCFTPPLDVMVVEPPHRTC